MPERGGYRAGEATCPASCWWHGHGPGTAAAPSAIIPTPRRPHDMLTPRAYDWHVDWVLTG